MSWSDGILSVVYYTDKIHILCNIFIVYISLKNHLLISCSFSHRVPVNSRNWYDIVFRIAEIGVALWFPCCLWNCMAPEQLWILNPRKLLSRQIDPSIPTLNADSNKLSPEEGQTFLAKKDCWICYDSDKPEPLIQPCRCTGDVSSVHHECLKRWLVESCGTNNEPQLSCKVCSHPYEIEKSKK